MELKGADAGRSKYR